MPVGTKGCRHKRPTSLKARLCCDSRTPSAHRPSFLITPWLFWRFPHRPAMPGDIGVETPDLFKSDQVSVFRSRLAADIDTFDLTGNGCPNRRKSGAYRFR